MGTKIGILTFHEADNYGATLQAYALYKVVRECSDAEIINYHCDFILKQIKEIGDMSLSKKIIAKTFKLVKHRAFKNFTKKNIKLSKEYTKETVGTINGNYKLIFVGSDQVWNIECTDSDSTYFMDFIEDDTLLCSYAASFGAAPYPGEEYSRYLGKFHTISLRESKYIDELKKTNSNIRIDIDPTMLLTPDVWKEFIKKPPIRNKYVFAYFVGEPVELLDKIKEYSKNKGLKIISNKTSPEFFLRCNPSDFLNWIYFAEHVFTNSFHGTVFSILFQKNFTVECKTKGGFNNRAYSLLEKLGLQELLIENQNNDLTLDWLKVNRELDSMRCNSRKYISEIIEMAGTRGGSVGK